MTTPTSHLSLRLGVACVVSTCCFAKQMDCNSVHHLGKACLEVVLRPWMDIPSLVTPTISPVLPSMGMPLALM